MVPFYFCLHVAGLCVFLSTSTRMVVPNQRPRYELVGGDIETLWQRPAVEPRGIFLIAHGCSHQASDIFSTVGPDGWTMEACHTTEVGRCLGLPEESQLRRVALARGYITMAVSSTGPGRCWTKEDRRRVLAAVEHVRLQELVSNATVFAMGASSGGAFVGLLSESVASGGLPSLQCIIPQISDLSGTNRGVPTLFIHMARDRRVGERVASDMESLKRQGCRGGNCVEAVACHNEHVGALCGKEHCCADLAEPPGEGSRRQQWLFETGSKTEGLGERCGGNRSRDTGYFGS